MTDSLPDPLVIRTDEELLCDYPNGIPKDRPVLLLAPRWDITEQLNSMLETMPCNIVGVACVLSKRQRIVDLKVVEEE